MHQWLLKIVDNPCQYFLMNHTTNRACEAIVHHEASYVLPFTLKYALIDNISP